MYKRYRLMIIGEDGTEFCFKNHIYEHDHDEVLKEAQEDYPEAYSMFFEDEGMNENYW